MDILCCRWNIFFLQFFNQSWIVLRVNCALFSCSDTKKIVLNVAPWNLTQFAQIEKIRGVKPVSFITLADREGQVSEFYFGSSLNSWVPPSKFNLAVSLHISTQANSAHTKCLSCTNTNNPSASNKNYKLFQISLKNIRPCQFQAPGWYSNSQQDGNIDSLRKRTFSQILVLSE